ncbi:MAG: hypothetical protein IT367_12330 [Candidatus Hydrogenedentes bacterium]|nr:hypothetical protein [Candidatus Hydrogenedentota bacterium]
MSIAIAVAVAIASAAGAAQTSPITATIPEGKQNATFTNALHPGNRIGYRFHEHTPLIFGDAPKDAVEAGIKSEEAAALESDFAKRSNILKKEIEIGDADWAPQTWTFYMAPVDDGVEMLWVVETKDIGLNEYYGVQQCFRLGGVTNEAWRREFAETPAFSEYDLWNVAEKDKAEKTSLSYVLRSGEWQTIPATRDPVGARTPLGIKYDTLRAGGDLNTMLKVGPYEARMLDPIDDGLITRINVDKTWVCGIYWERTSHITDHHPADCLHSIVNIGGIPPHSKRAIRGKIWWFEGILVELRTRTKVWNARSDN